MDMLGVHEPAQNPVPDGMADGDPPVVLSRAGNIAGKCQVQMPEDRFLEGFLDFDHCLVGGERNIGRSRNGAAKFFFKFLCGQFKKSYVAAWGSVWMSA